MTDLQKQFEATGYASWINSEIYPDGKIYTQEYTQWLEKQLQSKENALQNEKIVAAIAAYLDEKLRYNKTGLPRLQFQINHDRDRIARELAAAIAPMVNAQAQDFAGWICRQVIAGRTYHKLWLDYCEEKAIAPHLEAGAGWEDAPEWAEYIATDWNGQKHWFEKEPYKHNSGCWFNQEGTKYQKINYSNGDKWDISLQQRPHQCTFISLPAPTPVV